MSHDVKSIRQQFRAQGIFYTDIKLAKMLAEYMPSDINEVYDPTCGSGNLLSVFPDEVRKYGQELDAVQADEARKNLVNAEIGTGDTLLNPAFRDKRFRAIVANYPFSVKWSPEDLANDERFTCLPELPPPSKADYAFIAHILHMLADDGVAAVLGFPGILYRGQREGKIRQWLVEQGYIESVTHIKGDYFVDTKVATCLLVLRKNLRSGKILFRDTEHNVERLVPFDEIAANSFNLSISAYVQPPEPPKPQFNPFDAEMKARSGVLRQIKAQINFSAMVAQFEGWSIDPFLDDIIQLANSYKVKTKLNPNQQ